MRLRQDFRTNSVSRRSPEEIRRIVDATYAPLRRERGNQGRMPTRHHDTMQIGDQIVSHLR